MDVGPDKTIQVLAYVRSTLQAMGRTRSIPWLDDRVKGPTASYNVITPEVHLGRRYCLTAHVHALC